MASLKKYCNPGANSILESVIALCVISVCLCIAILVFATVFNPRSSIRAYKGQNKVNALFYTLQIKGDSLRDNNQDKDLNISETAVAERLKQVNITYKDSAKNTIKKQFYLLDEN